MDSNPKQTKVSIFIDNITSTFYIELLVATRFSAKPSHPNTFVNHYAGPNTPGYQNEEARFRVASRSNRTLQMKCDFQQDEAAKKNAIQQFRVAQKAANIDNLNAKICSDDQRDFAKNTQRLLNKAGAIDTHEKLSHL